MYWRGTLRRKGVASKKFDLFDWVRAKEYLRKIARC